MRRLPGWLPSHSTAGMNRAHDWVMPYTAAAVMAIPKEGRTILRRTLFRDKTLTKVAAAICQVP